MMTELAKHLSLNSGSMSAKDLAALSQAISNVSKAIILLRDEGRQTIRESQDIREYTADAVTPPALAATGAPAVLAPAQKISPPVRGPVALGDYLNHLNKDSTDE